MLDIERIMLVGLSLAIEIPVHLPTPPKPGG